MAVADNEESWGKAALNIGVEALPFVIGAGPGAVICILYLAMDKGGMFDRPEHIYYEPPRFLEPDKLRLEQPIINFRLKNNL